MNFCENGAGEEEQEQDGICLENLSEAKTVFCEEAVKEEEEEKREELMVKEEKEGDLKEEEEEEEEMVREESDSEERTENCALIRRSHSSSPEGPERLV